LLNQLKKNGYKVLGALLLIYSVVMGFVGHVPRLFVLNETIRALYFHVPMWFAMLVLLGTSAAYSIAYLAKPNLRFDNIAEQAAKVGVLFGVFGIVTGAIWANYTWGEPWSNDPKQNGSAIALLIYFAYLVLRNSFQNREQGARISAVYNILAFATLIPLLFILPRLTDSLHPGNGGNPAFGKYDLDNGMRMVFYPAVLAWIFIGFWVAEIQIRIRTLRESQNEWN